MSNDTPRRPKPESVLVVTHGDNYLEVFADEHVIVKVVRCPYTGDGDDQPLAEDCLEQTLTPYWRKLFYPGNVRATAVVRPLLASVANDSLAVGSFIKSLNGMESV